MATLLTSMVGCSVYLHSDALQKQTSSALASYKSADVTNAVKATAVTQSQFNQRIIDSVVAEDRAVRDEEVSSLLNGTSVTHCALPPGFQARIASAAAVEQLLVKIECRLTALGGPNYPFNPNQWNSAYEKIVGDQVILDQDNHNVDAQASRYAALGGTDFTGCRTFKVSTAQASSVEDVADDLNIACQKMLAERKALLADTLPVQDAGGLLANVNAELQSATTAINNDQQAALDAQKRLQKAKQDYEAATKEATDIDSNVTSALDEIQSALSDADKAVGALGGPSYEPSAALAAIRFRETSICDVIAASAKTSCSGGTATQAGTKINKAAVGLIAGITKVADLNKTPNAAAFQVALTYQTAIEASAQASLNELIAKQGLLANEQAALTEEVELLVSARAELTSEIGVISSANCRKKSLGELFQAKTCKGRQTVADALTDYALSWSRGRTPARVDEIRVTQLRTSRDLQVAQANAAARDTIIQTALNELDAYGQGGISPQTVASLVQALGIVAIAKGVN